MSRGSSRHPLYTTLWNTHEEDSAKEDYRILQGHLLLAHVGELLSQNNQISYESFDGQSEWKGFANSPYPACLTVRELSEARHAPLITQLNVAISPRDFAKSLDNLPQVHSQTLLKRLINLQRFLQKHHGLENWIHRNKTAAENQLGGGSPRVTGYVEISPQLIKRDLPLGDPDDALEHVGVTATVTETDLDHLKQLERLDADLDPNEIDRHEMLLVDFDADQAGTVAANTSAQQRHIAMANQLFPWAYQQLTLSELSGFLNKATHLFKSIASRKTTTPPGTDERETVANICLMRLMIFTGSDFDRARNAIIYLNHQPNQDVDVVYLFDEKIPCKWRIRAIQPEYKTQAILQNDAMDRPRTDFFELPDISYTDHILSFFVSDVISHPSAQFSLISKNSQDTRKKFRDFLKSLDPSGRLTEHKLSTFLFNRILEVSNGDICAASIICGLPHPLARVRLFYSVNSVKDLQQLYLKAVGAMADQLLKANRRQDKKAQPLMTGNPFSVGSRLCPNFDAVKRAVSSLKSEIIKNRCNPIEDGFHNQFVLWVLWHFNFATACRAIVDPYIPMQELDPVTGIGVLADKDDGTGYKSRLIWIPPSVRNLMEKFESYLNKVLEKYPSIRHTKQLPFFLGNRDRKLKAEPVQPRTLKPVMDPFLPYPANYHRRFVRTELLARGCPNEIVDAWMGHWHIGEEPWGPYSSFSFSEYRTNLENFLVPLLLDLGLDGTEP